jgi:hypothetical protein
MDHLQRSRAAAAGRSQNRAARRRAIVVNYAEDPDECADVIAELMAEYEVYVADEHEHCPNCPVVRSGPFIAYSMLEWKAIYADGCLDRWTVPDIHEYMLDHFPRKVSADRRLLGATPACARDLMYFLADRGSLRGEDPSLLGDAADELFERFVEANRDRRNWGFAKRTFTGPLGAVRGRMAERAEPEADELAARAPVGNVDDSLGNRRQAKEKAVAARRRQRKAARAARKRKRG